MIPPLMFLCRLHSTFEFLAEIHSTYIEAVINFRTDTFADKPLSHSPLLLQAAIVVVDCTTVYAENFIRNKAAVEEFTCSVCC